MNVALVSDEPCIAIKSTLDNVTELIREEYIVKFMKISLNSECFDRIGNRKSM